MEDFLNDDKKPQPKKKPSKVVEYDDFDEEYIKFVIKGTSLNFDDDLGSDFIDATRHQSIAKKDFQQVMSILMNV